jgi:hypothetical protein
VTPPNPADGRLSADDRQFLARRAWRVRWGRPVMLALVVVWCGLWAALVVRTPLLANPFHVVGRLTDDELAPTTVLLLAGIAPLAISMIGGLVLVVLVFGWEWARLERRYHDLVCRLDNDGAPAGDIAASKKGEHEWTRSPTA